MSPNLLKYLPKDFCYMCGDSDGMQFWRGIASQYQDDITYYVFKELNKKSRRRN